MSAPRAAIAVAVAIVAAPLLAVVGVTEAGGFRMFTRIERARLTIVAIEGGERRIVAPGALAPHLGVDARRAITQAQGGTIGEISVVSLDAALGAIAELACEVEDAERIEATLVRTTLEGAPVAERTEARTCGR